MKIIGWEINNTHIVIAVGAVFGGGACYALLRYLIRVKNSHSSSNSCRSRIREGEADQDLPLVLEHEYGNFRATCLKADPIAARYLHEIPEHFFLFQETFTRYIADTTTKHATRYRNALVFGSGTGCLVFRLSKIFDEVKGVEPSFSQVVTSLQFQNLSSVNYTFPAEGFLKTVHKTVKSPLIAHDAVKVPENKKNKLKENVEFMNLDIGGKGHLPTYLGQFQAVIVQNYLEDLDDPIAFLAALKTLVEPNGMLIISSTYNWKRTVSYEASGVVNSQLGSSFELLKLILQKDFTLVEDKNIPDLVCDSVRSSRIKFNHVTTWIRNNSGVTSPGGSTQNRV